MSALTTFYAKGSGDVNAHDGITIEFNGSKDVRRDVHHSIQSVSHSLESKTVTHNPKQAITGLKRKHPSDAGGATDAWNHIGVFWKSKAIQMGRKRKKAGNGKKVSPSFVHFVMEKTGIEQTDAIERLLKATQLASHHITHSDISFCGTKDKRGITLQQCCIRCPLNNPGESKENGVSLVVRNLCKAQTNRQLINAGIRIGNISLKSSPLRLGGSAGNMFTIVFRGVRILDDAHVGNLENASEKLKGSFLTLQNSGFVNFFGTQVLLIVHS